MMNASAASVRQQIAVVLTAWGMTPDLAKTTADMMAETDLLGVESHGISMLMMYERMRLAGTLNMQARPRVVKDTAATALVDGDAGLGHPVSVLAMNLAVDKALAIGIGMVGVRNSHHFGAAGIYARLAAERGAIGLVTSATRGVMMVPTGAAEPVLGTNPIAFAAPAGRNRAFVLDMATTTVAANKVKVYDLKTKPVPAGWVMDGAGGTVTDPRTAMQFLHERREGGLSPLGGTPDMGSHKGYGLAMMVHILGGTLTGSSFSPIRNRTQKPGDPENIGHYFQAIDPKVFLDDGRFQSDLDEVIDVMHATPPADPAKPVMVAGEPEDREHARRLRKGIPIPPALDRHIREICERSGAAYVLEAAPPA
jgi:LDH2 family malate/lactate/ureidoglycolate dehydrogenase